MIKELFLKPETIKTLIISVLNLFYLEI